MVVWVKGFATRRHPGTQRSLEFFKIMSAWMRWVYTAVCFVTDVVIGVGTVMFLRTTLT